mmetsp:Transcript_16383/g.49312  ORF Transcript_16383/g.49312 Transcript_16383/m.49312 type:complete len:218 (-) Transcript_16383:1290-1943(-)
MSKHLPMVSSSRPACQCRLFATCAFCTFSRIWSASGSLDTWLRRVTPSKKNETVAPLLASSTGTRADLRMIRRSPQAGRRYREQSRQMPKLHVWQTLAFGASLEESHDFHDCARALSHRAHAMPPRPLGPSFTTCSPHFPGQSTSFGLMAGAICEGVLKQARMRISDLCLPFASEPVRSSSHQALGVSAIWATIGRLILPACEPLSFSTRTTPRASS